MHGPPLWQSMGELRLDPREKKCLDKFYILDGTLYRHLNRTDSEVLMPSSNLNAIATFCHLTGSVLQAHATKLPPSTGTDTPFNIVVKTLTGRSIPLEVDSTTTVEDLKYMIQDSQGA